MVPLLLVCSPSPGLPQPSWGLTPSKDFLLPGSGVPPPLRPSAAPPPGPPAPVTSCTHTTVLPLFSKVMQMGQQQLCNGLKPNMQRAGTRQMIPSPASVLPPPLPWLLRSGMGVTPARDTRTQGWGQSEPIKDGLAGGERRTPYAVFALPWHLLALTCARTHTLNSREGCQVPDPT